MSVFSTKFSSHVHFCVHPFGWRCSPVTWTKFFRVLTKAARAHGSTCLAYVNDTLRGTQGSVGQARQARNKLTEFHRRASVAMHPDKGQFSEPCHLLHDHLGLEICTAPGSQGYMRAPARRDLVRDLARQLLSEAAHQRRRVGSKTLRSFAGSRPLLPKPCGQPGFTCGGCGTRCGRAISVCCTVQR